MDSCGQHFAHPRTRHDRFNWILRCGHARRPSPFHDLRLVIVPFALRAAVAAVAHFTRPGGVLSAGAYLERQPPPWPARRNQVTVLGY